MLFTIPLSFIKPEPVNCIAYNQTGYVLTYTRSKRDLSAFDTAHLQDNDLYGESMALQGISTMPAEEVEEETHHRLIFQFFIYIFF